eukprot:3752321-Pyramimonas_sp.AAC.2
MCRALDEPRAEAGRERTERAAVVAKRAVTMRAPRVKVECSTNATAERLLNRAALACAADDALAPPFRANAPPLGVNSEGMTSASVAHQCRTDEAAAERPAPAASASSAERPQGGQGGPRFGPARVLRERAGAVAGGGCVLPAAGAEEGGGGG